ncbi:MAG: hypothetical protein H0U76_22185 [Ktedonobacteraceae bacterium]|nr:hypothetical protein [Ktedonobacteraceae bacterium]
MKKRQYEWHAERIIFFDRTNRQRYEADGFVLVWRLPSQNGDASRRQFIGLGYHSQYREKELSLGYVDSETQLGSYGTYYPIHVTSGEQLVASAWSHEATIRWFLEQLAEQHPRPEYWQKAAYPDVLDRFPGGRSYVSLLEQFSICWEIVRLRRGRDKEEVRHLGEFFRRALGDQRLDKDVRGDLSDLDRCCVGLSTWQQVKERLEQWATNVGRVAPQLMPPYCATVSGQAANYRQLLAILQEEEARREGEAAPSKEACVKSL